MQTLHNVTVKQSPWFYANVWFHIEIHLMNVVRKVCQWEKEVE